MNSHIVPANQAKQQLRKALKMIDQKTTISTQSADENKQLIIYNFHTDKAFVLHYFDDFRPELSKQERRPL